MPPSRLSRAIAILPACSRQAPRRTWRGEITTSFPAHPTAAGQFDFPIGPAMTGSWFNADQAGQGFSIQVLPGQPLRLLATWFVFRTRAAVCPGSPVRARSAARRPWSRDTG